jgi:hypothetical protein
MAHEDPSKYNYGEAITPNDSTDLTDKGFRAIYVGTGGDVAIEHVSGGTPVVYANVPSGTILPVKIGQVNATGTTASNIVGLV